ncbi:MAG: tRNA1(Val) (adenine(37)-N6)-methyltransferase, partial [Bacteroidia bacterium]
AKKILDIGTGSGILALMMAQKSEAEITAIEIEENACKQAQINFKNSKWKNRIHLKNTSFQDFSAECTDKFDIIISNPPYFKNSLKPAKSGRAIARHTDSLNIDELFNCAARLMHFNSTLNIIFPSVHKEQLIQEASKNNMYLDHICEIQPNAEKATNRVIMSFSLTKKKLKHEKIVIELDRRNHYTNEYIQLTKDFYLKF